jgi:hypothetical protein
VTHITGIVTCILLLNFMHQQLHTCLLLHHLVLGAGEELQRAFAPFHASSHLAQLAAQVCCGSFIYLLGL